jgi:hypothetical protein
MKVFFTIYIFYSGYDKLSQWGFSISGCIDGYSRRLMWLEVGPSNSDPRYIAKYYLDSVTNLQYCPMLLVTDPGSENVIIASIQSYLRRSGNDSFSGALSHRYCKSTSNQRIEAWWSLMRRDRIDWWITFFRGLDRNGDYNKSSLLEKYCMRFLMMPILKVTLHGISNRWNKHRINTNRNANNPAGIPDVLYFGADERFGKVAEPQDTHFMQAYTAEQSISGSLEFDTFARTWASENNIPRQYSTPHEALQSFFELRRHALVTYEGS